jgi:hypothetical protein
MLHGCKIGIKKKSWGRLNRRDLRGEKKISCSTSAYGFKFLSSPYLIYCH